MTTGPTEWELLQEQIKTLSARIVDLEVEKSAPTVEEIRESVLQDMLLERMQLAASNEYDLLAKLRMKLK